MERPTMNRDQTLALPHDELMALAWGEDCPVCGNNDWCGGGFCYCSTLRDWGTEFRSKVPKHDRDISLDTLAPSDKSRLSFEKQQEVIDELRANSTKSYAFFGPVGTSKTTFCVALYRKVLWDAYTGDERVYTWDRRPQTVWRVSAKYLLDEFVGYSKGERKLPNVNRKAINECYDRPHLFIEEIDKVTYTKFKTDTLFELIDAIYENDGQLVFNTNLTPAEFEAQFWPPTGPAFTRRIGEQATIKNFFE
jgi:DNA replication protein DnaC